MAEDFEQQAASHRIHHEKFDGIPFDYDQQSEIMKFGQFESDGKNSDVRISKLPKDERRKSRTFVFINGKFKEGLKIQFSTINKTVKIDGGIYYYFFNSKAWKSNPYYPFKSLEKDFPLKEPEIIQITGY